jgi:hypothetical protein
MDRAHWADGWALLTRVVGPALVLWGVVVGIGFRIAGALSGPLRTEVEVNKDLAADRSHTWNMTTLLAYGWYRHRARNTTDATAAQRSC